MPSFKLKRKVLCGRSYTSPILVLFFIGCLFFIFLAFKPYLMVNSSTAQYLLWVFGLFANQNLMSIWTSSHPNLKFAWWNLQQSVDTTVTISCWKVALAEMLIVVLDNQKQPSEVFCKEIALKDFSNFTGKPVPSSLQLYYKEIPTQVFFCEICIFFFLFLFFLEFLFWRTPASDCFWKILITIYMLC